MILGFYNSIRPSRSFTKAAAHAGLGGGRKGASRHSTAVSLHLHQLRARFRELGQDVPGEHVMDML